MSNSKSLIQFETGVTPYAMSALTDSGDHKTFNSAVSLFSNSSGNEPDVRPNGLITGGKVVPAASLTNNAVDVAALSCYLAGVKTAVAAGADKTITRPATAVAKVNSLTVTSAGALAFVAGTDGASTTFSSTRGAAGGPPLIPVGSIEIAQVRVISNTAAPITASEIFQVIGTHVERYDYPSFSTDNFNGTVVFDSALPLIHTGPVAKAVYASYAEPVFITQRSASEFVPADTSHSVSSTEVYGGVIGTSSKSLGQATFTAELSDGITDAIMACDGDIKFIKYFQNENKSPYILTQGVIGLGRTFNVSKNPMVKVTISPTTASVNRAS
jgi:hypothetical protein